MKQPPTILVDRLARLAALLTAALAAVATHSATAGELTLAWSPAGPAAMTSYRVYVGEQPGTYDRVVDAGSALRATIADLEDDRVHYFAVKALDAAGSVSPDFSAELACMASPRVTSVEAPALAPGGSAWVRLRGANFDREVQVRSLAPELKVRATSLEADGSLSVLVEATGEARVASAVPMPSTGSFALFNPCRRAASFYDAHPQIADVDGSGSVDEDDVRAIAAAIGSRRGESRYRAAADLDGDGLVDGRDLDREIALARAR